MYILNKRHCAILIYKSSGDFMGLAPKPKRPGTAARAWSESVLQQCLVEEVLFFFESLGLISMSDCLCILIFCVQGEQKM